MRKVIPSLRRIDVPHPELDYPEKVITKRTSGNVPVLCSSEVIPISKVKEKPVFGHIVGSPISKNAEFEIVSNAERLYLMKQVFSKLIANTSCVIIVTSHDQSRNGSKRANSEGHLLGSATDIILCIKDEEDGNYYPIVDLVNSISLVSFLRSMAEELQNVFRDTQTAWGSRQIIFGIEYDHIHIEWPWTLRSLPFLKGFIRIPEMPAGFLVGLYYHPQTVYGLPSKRAGLDDGILYIL